MHEIINIEDKIKEIKQRIHENGYTDQLITYQQLQDLHQEYLPDISEKGFAIEVLELTQGNYSKMKNKGSKGRILKVGDTQKRKKNDTINIETIEYIQDELKKEGYEDKLISYEELQQLHKKFYPNIEEKIFAQEILKLTYANYSKMKNKGQRGKILKRKNTISIEKIKQAKSKLTEEFPEGSLISYKEVQKLHKKYLPEVDEKTFALEVLGFTYEHYLNVKNKGKKGKIKDKINLVKTDYIKNGCLTETRYYTIAELEEICRINNITIEEFIKYVILKFNTYKLDEAISHYIEAINKHGKLWIGKTPLSPSFAEKYTNAIYARAQRVTYKYKAIYQYNNQDAEDYIQDLVMYILETCGDIEKNFEDKPNFFKETIYNKMKYRLIEKIFLDRNINIRLMPSTKRYTISGEEKEFLSEGPNDIEDVENYNSFNYRIAEQSIHRLKELVAQGCEKKMALSKVQEEFNLSKEDLISIMKYYIDNMKAHNPSTGEPR